MLGIQIDRSSNISITRQLCDQLRDLIIQGKLKPGTRLPPTRKLSEEYKIARNIVIEVYEQLIAEGFLETITGSGTFVAEGILPMIKGDNNISIKRETYKEKDTDIIDFMSGVPDLKLFPYRQWMKCFKEAMELPKEEILGYGSTSGDFSLRKNIADYLLRFRGIHCYPEQVIIISGASQGFLLIAKTFSDTFNSICLEEPNVDFIPDIFSKMNYTLEPVEVDDYGIKVENFVTTKERKLILLTPSHQFPTGSILSIQRRQMVIEWAKKTDSLIIEDDYDSEFRFKGVPIPPLLNLDNERVIYVGTFSKNLSPGLRLGFLILPQRLCDNLKKIKYDLNMFSPQINQKILSLFISHGYFERHIYQMNKVYKKKWQTLTQTLKDSFGDDIKIQGSEGGLHIALEFNPQKYSHIDWEKSVEYKVKVYPFNLYSLKNKEYKNKIVLGYGNLSLDEIKKGVERLFSFVNSSFS